MNSSKHSLPKTKPHCSPSRWNKPACCLAIALLAIFFALPAFARSGNVFYMSPQGEYKTWMDTGVVVQRTNDRLDMDLRRLSTDGKRWFAITYSLVDLGPGGGQRLDYHIHTYANKDHLVRVSLLDVLSDGVPEVRWLNDKLIYIEFWWRSTVGGYLIFDTDNEYIVAREMMFIGGPPVITSHPRLKSGRGYQQ